MQAARGAGSAARHAVPSDVQAQAFCSVRRLGVRGRRVCCKGGLGAGWVAVAVALLLSQLSRGPRGSEQVPLSPTPSILPSEG